MVVQHNLTAMNSNRMLGLTTASQAKSTEKLSSGYKINRAADDAAGLSISEKMRKQIRGLTQASSNAQDGISAVQTAEGALNEVQDMLQRMNELAVKAANGTNSESDRSYIQDEIDQLVTEIDRVAETTKFNETYLLKGDVNGEKAIDFKYKAAKVTTQDLQYLKDGKAEILKAGSYAEGLTDNGITYFKGDVDAKQVGTLVTAGDTATLFTKKDLINATNYYQTDAEGNYVMVNKGDVKNSKDYFTVTFTTDGTVGSATKVATPSTAAGYVVAANQEVYDKSGAKLTAGASVDAAKLTTDYFKAKGEGKFDAADKVTDWTGLTTDSKVQLTDKDGNEIAENGLKDYFTESGTYKGGLYKKVGDKITSAEGADIDNLIDKEGRQDIGVLELKLHVGADATDNNQITMKLQSMSAKILGIDGLKVDGANDTNARNAIETIAAALQTVSTQRSALGAIQNRLEHTINNLDNVVENTTSAESQIRDTDMATEMVKYSNNNILAQAGQAMLAQANQANQGVLSLLG